ncbi:MAG: aldehyde ferredoxin oxidoreductase N-terminal domain-containing protein [Desulfurococcaceae archaeon]
MNYRALFIDVSKRSSWVKEYAVPEVMGAIDLGIEVHLKELKTYNQPPYSPLNALVIGRGILAGTKLYGVNRLVAVFRSPLTRGLHVASMGGAAYQFKVKVDALSIIGSSEVPLIIKVYDEGDGVPKVEFTEINDKELEEIWVGYGDFKGVYALQKYLSEKHKDFYSKYNGRSILVGPASKYTNIGALFSITLHRGEMDLGSEDFAARGGPGSVLYRAHHVAAIIYGGLYDVSKDRPLQLNESKWIMDWFIKNVGTSYPMEVIKAGVKYRYDDKLKSGGTFGSNYPHLKTATPMFNFNNIYLPIELRDKLHGLIMKYMWEPFNKEAIETKSWKVCGEPCPIACKKVRKGKYKSDYEPYEGLGPFIGIFDLHEIERVVELADSYGFDAIELGHLIGFIFEALERGLLKPDEVGLSSKPLFNPSEYRIEYSKHNADLAIEIIERLAWGKQPLIRLIGERGLRSSAKILDVLYKERVEALRIKFEDLIVYAPFGEEGHITPNYYWTPGLVAPLAITGRYWTLYASVFLPPEEYAKKSFERALWEYFDDNIGSCRFHRGWIEARLPKILNELMGVSNIIDILKKKYRDIVDYQEKARAQPVFWDSKKTIDIVATAAKEFESKEWAAKFSENRLSAAVEWWNKFYEKLSELIKA